MDTWDPQGLGATLIPVSGPLRSLAILGGIDVDFLCRSTPQAIRERSAAMLRRAARRGAYALGSGNSLPDYVPDEGYLAMRSAAVDG